MGSLRSSAAQYSRALASLLLGETYLLVLLVVTVIIVVIEYYLLGRPVIPDYGTVALVAGLLVASRALVVSGLAENAALSMLSRSRGSARRLALSLAASSALLAAVATNDGAVLIIAPLAASLARLTGADRDDLVAVTLIAVNAGSSASPIGNPQNIIIWQHYGLSALSLVMWMLPFLLVSLTLLSILVYRRFSGRVYIPPPAPVRLDRGLASVGVLLIAANILLGEARLGVVGFALTVTIIAATRRHVLRSVDWRLVLLILLLFADFQGLTSLLQGRITLLTSPLIVYLLGILLSQVVSNVPATIALAGLTSHWRPLILAVNAAGYATPVSSLANLLGLRLSGVPWRSYLRKTWWFTLAASWAGLVQATL